MSKALEGEQYCLDHQGNHSHYDKHNCTVCKLTQQVEALEEEIAWRRDAPVVGEMQDTIVQLRQQVAALENRGEEYQRSIDNLEQEYGEATAKVEALTIERDKLIYAA